MSIRRDSTPRASETSECFSESRPAAVLCLNTDSLWKRRQSRSSVTCLLTPAPPDGADGSALMRPSPNPHPVRDAGCELSADDLQHPSLPPRPQTLIGQTGGQVHRLRSEKAAPCVNTIIKSNTGHQNKSFQIKAAADSSCYNSDTPGLHQAPHHHHHRYNKFFFSRISQLFSFLKNVDV